MTVGVRSSQGSVRLRPVVRAPAGDVAERGEQRRVVRCGCGRAVSARHVPAAIRGDGPSSPAPRSTCGYRRTALGVTSFDCLGSRGRRLTSCRLGGVYAGGTADATLVPGLRRTVGDCLSGGVVPPSGVMRFIAAELSSAAVVAAPGVMDRDRVIDHGDAETHVPVPGSGRRSGVDGVP